MLEMTWFCELLFDSVSRAAVAPMCPDYSGRFKIVFSVASATLSLPLSLHDLPTLRGLAAAAALRLSPSCARPVTLLSPNVSEVSHALPLVRLCIACGCPRAVSE